MRRSFLRLTAAALLLPILGAIAEPMPVARVANAEPAPGPDGSLAFVSNRSGGMQVFALAAQTAAPVQLTTTGGPWDTPAWSPDGRWIAAVDEASGSGDIVVFDARGAAARRLVASPSADLHPNWSADGRRIVFTRFTAQTGTDEATLSIHAIEVAGGDEQALGPGSYASWSPDGKRLVYWRQFDGNAEIVVRTEAGGETRLTRDPAFDGWPSWSPDGTRIVFARERGDDADLVLLDPETGKESAMLSGRGRRTSPKFSRDGRWIYFQWTNDGHTGIWRVEAPTWDRGAA